MVAPDKSKCQFHENPGVAAGGADTCAACRRLQNTLYIRQIVPPLRDILKSQFASGTTDHLRERVDRLHPLETTFNLHPHQNHDFLKVDCQFSMHKTQFS